MYSIDTIKNEVLVHPGTFVRGKNLSLNQSGLLYNNVITENEHREYNK